MYFNCEKEQIKEAFEEIKDLVKDIKNNNMYLSNKENLALQTIELYVNDSTPNCYIRDKIKEYEGLKEMDMQAYEEQVKPLQEILKEE